MTSLHMMLPEVQRSMKRERMSNMQGAGIGRDLVVRAEHYHDMQKGAGSMIETEGSRQAKRPRPSSPQPKVTDLLGNTHDNLENALDAMIEEGEDATPTPAGESASATSLFDEQPSIGGGPAGSQSDACGDGSASESEDNHNEAGGPADKTTAGRAHAEPRSDASSSNLPLKRRTATQEDGSSAQRNKKAKLAPSTAARGADGGEPPQDDMPTRSEFGKDMVKRPIECIKKRLKDLEQSEYRAREKLERVHKDVVRYKRLLLFKSSMGGAKTASAKGNARQSSSRDHQKPAATPSCKAKPAGYDSFSPTSEDDGSDSDDD